MCIYYKYLHSRIDYIVCVECDLNFWSLRCTYPVLSSSTCCQLYDKYVSNLWNRTIGFHIIHIHKCHAGTFGPILI